MQDCGSGGEPDSQPFGSIRKANASEQPRAPSSDGMDVAAMSLAPSPHLHSTPPEPTAAKLDDQQAPNACGERCEHEEDRAAQRRPAHPESGDRQGQRGSEED